MRPIGTTLQNIQTRISVLPPSFSSTHNFLLSEVIKPDMLTWLSCVRFPIFAVKLKIATGSDLVVTA